MTGRYTLYGWHLSYFAGKARCYLEQKRIPFDDVPVDFITLTRKIRKRFGTAVMPVVVTPEGEWIQDTSIIIDELEKRFPEAPVVPPTPVLKLASYIMEMWGDEWWIPIAMHTRWTYPENYPLFEDEAGRALLPWVPAFARNWVVKNKVAKLLRGYLPQVGIVPEQYLAMDSWTRTMLDLLDAHFRSSKFLFGNRASLGDFGLVGTMYGHLGRDPWPKRELIAPRPALRAWIDRMAGPGAIPPGDFSADDKIAPTLEPVFAIIFREFIPYLEATLNEVRKLASRYPHGQTLPRGLGQIECPMGNTVFRRNAIPYTLWMAQRVLDVFKAMAPEEQVIAKAWVASLGGLKLFDLGIPRLERRGVHVALT